MHSAAAATLFICVSCNAADGGVEKPGRLLFDAVHAQAGPVTVTPVECLSVCKRPCTVALAAAGKWTYMFGDLDHAGHADDVITMARSYAASDTGIVPWRERPLPFRRGIVSRVPPVGFSNEG